MFEEQDIALDCLRLAANQPGESVDDVLARAERYYDFVKARVVSGAGNPIESLK